VGGRANLVRGKLPERLDDQLLFFGGFEIDQCGPHSLAFRPGRARPTPGAIRKWTGITREMARQSISSPARLPRAATAEAASVPRKRRRSSLQNTV
jgi:hypothetical protein